MMQGGSPWNAQQQRWLRALGHAVLRVGGEPEPSGILQAPAEVPSPRPSPEPQRGMRVAVDEVAPRRASPTVSATATVDADTGVGADSPQRPAVRRPVRLPDRLQLAMLRASGLDPADPAALATMAQWPVERMRGDAAAKRAFWPQLRALRRRKP